MDYSDDNENENDFEENEFIENEFIENEFIENEFLENESENNESEEEEQEQETINEQERELVLEFQLNERPNVNTFINSLFQNVLSRNANRFFNNVIQSMPSAVENQLLQRSFEEKSKYKLVLNDEGEDQLKKVLYKDSSKKNSACPISMNEFNDDTEVIELPCKHCFFPKMIQKWLKEEQAVCPICRFKLESKEEKIKEKNINSFVRRIPNTVNHFLDNLVQREEEEALQAVLLRSLDEH